ncbi:TPA: hypothetical protein DEG75_03435 [Candidatus Dependentiae bacterium]|nr:hypothetical protein [Candidatus Dependentiae bacterium]
MRIFTVKHLLSLLIIGLSVLSEGQIIGAPRTLHDVAVTRVLQQRTNEHPGTIQFSPKDRSLLANLYNLLIQNNPHKNQVATVRTFPTTFTLCPQEEEFLELRNQKCLAALEAFIGEKIDPATMPNIGVVGSGGGFRAMFSVAGFLSGLDHIGFLDAARHITSLSGSTWAITPWMYSDMSYQDFAPILIKRATSGILSKQLDEQIGDIVNSLVIVGDCFLRKLAFNEIPTIIDLYGLLLAMTLLDPTQKNSYLETDLSKQALRLADGSTPMPIYTAVAAHKKEPFYHWVEFTPYEVALLDDHFATESWGFGRAFSKGQSVNAAPSLSAGFLMGCWGSAISPSVKEIYQHTIGKIEPQALFKPLQDLLGETSIGNLRFFPAYIKTPSFKMENVPLSKEKHQVLIDSGFELNLPVVSLIQPARSTDLILICDISGDIETLNELKKTEIYAQQHNLPFPRVSYEGLLERPFTVFDDGPEANTPVVVYFPLCTNQHFNPHFDPCKFLGIGGFLNTSNFAYSEYEAGLIAGLFKTAAQDAQDALQNIVRTLIQRKAQRLSQRNA